MSTDPHRRDGRALPAAMGWAGPGRTAFAGDAGTLLRGESRAASGPEGLRPFGSRGDPLFHRALEDYFAAGGGPCSILNLPPPATLTAERRATEWVGGDGEPGYRVGLWSLLDLEEVGTIALPGLLDRGLRRTVLESLGEREDRFLVLDALPGGEEETLPALPRAAVIEGWRDGADGPIPPSGRALGLMEVGDFSEERPQVPVEASAGRGHPTLGERFASIEAWRLWEGLRRSIDLGTRWVIFEEQGDLLFRRLEREVGGFLARLHRWGLLEGREPEDAFRVRVRTGSHSADGRLSLEVEARVRGCAPAPLDAAAGAPAGASGGSG